MESLAKYVNNYVEVFTLDNKLMIGILMSFDQSLNMMLKNYIEIETNTEYDEEPTINGVILVRGSNVSCISLLNNSSESMNYFKQRKYVSLPNFDVTIV